MKRRRARVALSERCSHIVSYVHYIRRGVKTHRHGRCSGWTITTCGLCPRHCRAACSRHRIVWQVIEERAASLRAILAAGGVR